VSAEHLIMVGKGGVGKSTTAANLTAALAETGSRVLVIGYNPKGNSTAMLRGAGSLLPFPDWRHGPNAPLYSPGCKNSLCVEAAGLAGMGDTAPAAHLLRHPLIADFRPGFVIHDLDWEPGAPFALPGATEGIARLFVVTSADMGAISAANEIFAWLNTVAAVDCRFGGVIGNNLSGPLYNSIVADYAARTNACVVANIAHSLIVSLSGFYRQALIDAAPFSRISYAYQKLARLVLEPNEVRRPSFLMRGALRQWAIRWGEIITELETGVVQDGSNI